jgi:DNA primase
MDVKEDIRARLPIEQLVAQYCQLLKKGRNYVCLCPFHNDKKPSLLVSPDKGILTALLARAVEIFSHSSSA